MPPARSLCVALAAGSLLGTLNRVLAAQQPTRPVAAQARADTTPRSARAWKILGVYDEAGPLDSVEVRDVISGIHALTTSTGTVALSFLSRPTGTRILLRKIGYNAFDTTVTTGPADTVPLVIVMTRVAATTLPTVVTTDKKLLPNMQGFEERRLTKAGAIFLGPEDMTKQEGREMARVLQSKGISLVNARGQRGCVARVYIDGRRVLGIAYPEVHEVEAIEYYHGESTVPSIFDGENSRCGVIVYWLKK
jgi:hypothetical protein